MHFEVPRVRLHSFREFASHYLMIVVSILTALGLEALIENAHHRHAAEAAQRAIETELRLNIEGVRHAIQENEKRLKPLAALDDGLSEALSRHVPDAELSARIAERAKAGIDLGLFVPTLRHEAWDVAVANQSVGWIEPSELGRLSAAYSSVHDATNSAGIYTPLFDGPRFVDAVTDARTQAANPREFVRALHQAVVTLSATESRLLALEQILQRALAPAGSEPAPGIAP
jgi:hypothetical protein